MTARWIVGIDGSTTAVDALRWAARHGRTRHVELTALGAFQVPGYLALFSAKRGFGVDEVGLAATAGHEIDVALEQVADEVQPGEITVQPVVVEGPAAHVLVDAAAEPDVSLLVVGRRGTSELRGHIFGSVSRYCVTHASVPVVVVPSGWDVPPAARIVVGFDGSEEATNAVRWALEFARDAEVTVLSAIDLAPWISPELTRERFPDEVAAEEARINGLLDEIDPDQQAQRSIVLHGPRQALAEAVGDYDLLVVGAAGTGRAVGLGSVSTWSLHDSPVPVVVVPA